MNRPEVLAALQDVLRPDSERYKRASQEYGHLASEAAEASIATALAPPVVEVLRRQSEYVRYPAMAIHDYFAKTSVEPNWAAQQLVRRALKNTAEDAVNWLAGIVERRRATGTLVMPLWQMKIEKRVALMPNAQLVPFSELPDSVGKKWLEDPGNIIHGGGILPASILGFEKPAAAITIGTVISPLFVNLFDAPPPRHGPDNILDDIRLCLSSIGPHPLLGPIQWFEFDDPAIAEVGPRGFGSSRLEILPYSLPSPITLDLNAARRIVAGFFSMAAKDRHRTRIALERLVQAMLRREPGNTAADLSIALETLLTDQAGEHTWKVSTRAGVLTGWDLQSRLRRRNVIVAAYQMRSSLVHSGTTSKYINVAGIGKQPARGVCKEAVLICAAAIRAIIERGGVPSWPEFDCSAGISGWRRTAVLPKGNNP
jgi:hypothetical protein